MVVLFTRTESFTVTLYRVHYQRFIKCSNMKLYATTTSERASKGQGGNNIEITIQNKEKDILLRFEVKTKDERVTDDSRLSYFSKVIDGDINFLTNLKSNIAFFLDITKAEKQKADN
jgi:hypothetical protein